MKKIYLLLVAPFIVWGASITSNEQDYVSVCKRAQSEEHFSNFRRHPAIGRVIEGVPKHIGARCLALIRQLAPDYSQCLSRLEPYEKLGNPKRYSYDDVGNYSACTLRYVKILADMRKRFGKFDDMNVIEIGGGFGGQCAIMSLFEKFNTYTLIDLPCVLGLAQVVLNKLNVANVHMVPVDQLETLKEYDLIISNYAFSEIDAKHQLIYLEKVIKNVPRGYLTMNFIGARNNIHALSLDKIKAFLTDAGHQVKVEAEKPQTNPRGKPNVLLTWGEELL